MDLEYTFGNQFNSKQDAEGTECEKKRLNAGD